MLNDLHTLLNAFDRIIEADTPPGGLHDAVAKLCSEEFCDAFFPAFRALEDAITKSYYMPENNND